MTEPPDRRSGPGHSRPCGPRHPSPNARSTRRLLPASLRSPVSRPLRPIPGRSRSGPASAFRSGTEGRRTRSAAWQRLPSPARGRFPGTRGRSPVRNGEGGTGRTGGGSRVPPSPGRSFPRDRGMRKAKWTQEGAGRSCWGGTLLNMILEQRNVPLGADVRIHRTASHERSPPPRQRSRSSPSAQGRLRRSGCRKGFRAEFSGRCRAQPCGCIAWRATMRAALPRGNGAVALPPVGEGDRAEQPQEGV